MTHLLSEWTPSVTEVNGHAVHALLRNALTDSAPLVFLHGITASAELWPLILGDQFRDRRCASISLPGHAPSEVPDGFSSDDVTPHLFADCVAEVTQRIFPGEPVHLVGWSTGGFAALVTAALHPAITASVTSISGFARGNWGSLLGVMQTLARSDWGAPLFRANIRALGQRRWLLNRVLNRFAAKPMQRDSIADAAVDSMMAALSNHDAETLRQLFRGLREIDATGLLNNIQAPGCIIGGDADPVISPEESQHLAECIPGSQLHVINDCGHLFFAEAHGRVMNIITEAAALAAA